MPLYKENKELNVFNGDALDKITPRDFVPSQNYHKLLKYCQKKGVKFIDPVFPPDENSLYIDHNPVPEGKVLEWKRITELYPEGRLFVDGVDVTDVNQGDIGNCWFVAALSLMATKKALLTRLIPDYQDADNAAGREFGIYRFRFWRYGEWVEVVVDDYLPVYEGKFIYCHSNDQNEFWSALVEKAYAKINSSYESMISGVTDDALTDFSGGITERYDLGPTGTLVHSWKHKIFTSIQSADEEKKKSLFDICVESMKRPAMVSTAIDIEDEELRESKTDMGLIVGHAYAITGMAKITSMEGEAPASRLIRLRNPWGKGEWTGDWSDESPLWSMISEEEREQVLPEMADDGEFWMSWDDFALHFTTLSITRLVNSAFTPKDQRWHISLDRGVWSKEALTSGGCLNNKDTFLTHNRQLSLKLDRNQVIYIGLMQHDRRDRGKIGETNMSIGFYLFSVESNRTLRLGEMPRRVAGKAQFCNAREVTSRIELFAGHYFLIPCTFLHHQEGQYLIRLLTEGPHTMEDVIESVPVPRFKMFGAEPIGRMVVRVAHGGPKKPKSESQYYVSVYVGHGKSSRTRSACPSSLSKKTQEVIMSAAPIFDEELTFPLAKRSQPVVIKLYEAKKLLNKYLGGAKVNIAKWFDNPNMTGTTQVNIFKTARMVGRVEIELTYVPGFADPFQRARKSEFEKSLKKMKNKTA